MKQNIKFSLIDFDESQYSKLTVLYIKALIKIENILLNIWYWYCYKNK